MSRKTELKRTDRREVIRVAIFGTLTVISAVLFLVGMVNNSNGAVERFNTLNAVDQAGGDVESALTDLRDYIHSHMNTEIGGPNSIYPPIQLSGTYNRLIETRTAEIQKLNEEAKQTNEQVRQDADRLCANQFPAGQLIQRAECNANYIEANSVSEVSETVEVDDSFYKFNFVAPRWSPDLAGFSLIAMIIFGVVTVVNLLLHWRTKHLIHMAN